MILIAMIGIAVSIANKKKTAEAQKRRTAFPEKGNLAPGAGSVRNPQNRSAPNKPSTASKSATLSKTPSAPGTSKWPWPTQNSPQQKKSTSSYGGTPQYTHVVTSTLEGGHTHTESSMTGEDPCPPPKPVTKKQTVEKAPAANTNPGALLNYQPNSVLQGVIYAEILGKPKALQRH